MGITATATDAVRLTDLMTVLFAGTSRLGKNESPYWEVT